MGAAVGLQERSGVKVAPDAHQDSWVDFQMWFAGDKILSLHQGS